MQGAELPPFHMSKISGHYKYQRLLLARLRLHTDRLQQALQRDRVSLSWAIRCSSVLDSAQIQADGSLLTGARFINA